MFVMYRDNLGELCEMNADSIEGLIDCMKSNSQTPIRTFGIYKDNGIDIYDSELIGYIQYDGENFCGQIIASNFLGRTGEKVFG